MTAVLTPAPAPASEQRVRRSSPPWVAVVVRWVVALAGAFVIFGILLMTQGADPFQAYADMISLTFGSQLSIEKMIRYSAPLILGALAIAVPARAGLTNVGGEGQIIVGGVASFAAASVLDDFLPGFAVIVGMMAASMIAGAIWAGIAAAMRLMVGVNEAITTLLLNFVALYFMQYLIYGAWRENPAGQATTKELVEPAQLPLISGTDVHIGIIVALVAVVLVWVLLNRTRWGFAVSVAGGNAEAARRSGMKVTWLVLSALVIGGALAGLAGMIHYSGVELKLRDSFGYQLGYIAFLASWLARHKPFPIILASLLFSALSVASFSLQSDANVAQASVNVLTALILIAVLGFTAQRKKASS